MIADDLRRQTDQFIDLSDLRDEIGRDPSERRERAQHPPRPRARASRISPISEELPSPEPARDCPLCPRLVQYRHEQRKLHPDWFNAPVPSFGTADARLLIVGLAPGVQGANRTGRPFTGDFAGDLLYETLKGFGFARGHVPRGPA